MASVDTIRESLREVLDPELGINVVDLGLVFDVRLNDLAVEVDLGMTSPTCPLGPVLKSNAETAVRKAMPDGARVTVNLRSDLTWEPSRMSPEAKSRLGWK